ncbi:MAG: dihydroneopterin aldolase [Chitinophagia bacterium]|nr:dihydroneopterin aldolase [Chitinophagia bacterium]
MLCVSLHKVKFYRNTGLYSEELHTGNSFEWDIDLYATGEPLPFIDYAVIYEKIAGVMAINHPLLENYIELLHTSLKATYPTVNKIKITMRKMHPPLPGEVGYAQVSFEA